MLWIHVLAGSISILAGMLAFAARKGGPLHRRAGMAFAVAMIVMTASAVIMAAYLRPNVGNVIAGTLTGYLVATGLLTVRAPIAPMRAWLVGLMLAAFTVGSAAGWLAMAALDRPSGSIDGIPAPAFIMFACIAWLGGLTDLRMLRWGALDARQRLTRHLWRMGYAMWIATLSLFLGQARQFPAPLRESGLLAVPVLLITLALLYWVVRIRIRRLPLPARRAARPVRPKADSTAAAGASDVSRA